MRSKISFFMLIVVLFSFILSFSGTSVSGSNQSTIQNPGVFVSEVASLSPGTLDPATATNPQALGFIQLMYDGLFQYMNNSMTELAPDLSTGPPTVSSNGLVYTFNIRVGVQFTLQEGETKGQTLNAYVLQYSIDRAIIMNAHDGPTRTIDQWIKGAQSVGNTQDLNVSQAITFLNQQSVKAISATQLQITLSKPYGGFLQSLMQPVADAVSPKAIIDNEPYNYTTKQDNTLGMVSLASFFPGMNNKTILQNLELPSTYNIDNSGVVPQSDPTGPAAYTWLTDHSAGTGPYYLYTLVQGKLAGFAKNSNWWNKAWFQNASPNNIQISQVANTSLRINDLKNGTIDQGDVPFSDLSEFGVTANHTASNYTGVNSYIYNTLTTLFIGMNMNASLPSNQIIEDSTISNYNYGTHNVSRLFKYSWNNTTGNPQMARPGNPFSALLFREAFAYAFPTRTFINQALLGFGFPMQGVIPKGLLGYNNSLITDGYIPAYSSSKAQTLFNEVGWKGTIVMYYDSNSDIGNISAFLLAQSVNALHVKITIKPTAVGSVNWNPSTGQYALFQSSYSPPFADPQVSINAFYQSKGTFAGAINYDNPYVNDLINKSVRTLDPYNRSVLFNQVQTNATADYPYIYLSQEQNVLLLRSSIQGVDNPAADSLNPMLYFLPLQYLAKGTPGAYNPSRTGCGYGFPCGMNPSTPHSFQIWLTALIAFIFIAIFLFLIYGYLKGNKGDYRKKGIRYKNNNQIVKTSTGLVCPKCNALIKPEDVFCEECGTKL